MNQEIAVELHFFGYCILWGGLVLLAYDLLRVIRRLIKHGTFWLALEDLIFWIITGVFIFTMIYKQNNGIIRGFAIMGMTIGMLLYNGIIKDHLVNIIVKGIRILMKPFAIVIQAIRKVIVFVYKKLNKVCNILLKRLKLINKSIKMKASMKRQKRLQKKQERHLERQKKLEQKAATKKKSKKNTKKASDKKSKNVDTDKISNEGSVNKQLQVHKSGATFQKLSEEELKQSLLRNRR